MKIIIRTLIVLLPFILPNIIHAVSVYNSDGRRHDIEVTDIRSGSQQIMTIYNTSTAYVRCRYGCEIKVLETDDRIAVEPETLGSSTTVVIGDGTLRIR
jgi:predicted transcriptional regulator